MDLNILARTLAERLFDLQEAGRIMHHTWTNGKRAQGFVGPYDICTKTGLKHCDRFPDRHDCKYHADLIGWDDLSQQQKDFNINSFREVFAVLQPRAEAVIREAIEKTQQQERLRLAEEAEKSSYLRLVLADVPKHVALWLRGQA